MWKQIHIPSIHISTLYFIKLNFFSSSTFPIISICLHKHNFFVPVCFIYKNTDFYESGKSTTP